MQFFQPSAFSGQLLFGSGQALACAHNPTVMIGIYMLYFIIRMILNFEKRNPIQNYRLIAES